MSDDPSSVKPRQAHAPLNRREWLTRLMAAGAGFTAVWLYGSHFDADMAEAATAPSTAPASDDALFAAFMRVSQRLTDRASLDAGLARRYLHALQQQDPAFTKRLQAVDANADADPAVATAILSAWYLGQVGVGDPPVRSGDRSAKEPQPVTPIVVAYEAALMFEPVKDVLTLPSYCRDVPGYWAAQPPALHPSPQTTSP